MAANQLTKVCFSLLLGACLNAASFLGVRAQQAPSPYRTDLLVDGALITGFTGLGVAGVYLVGKKEAPTEAKLATLDKNDVPGIDRWVAGKYSERAQRVSDVLFYPTMVIAPGLLAVNKSTRAHFGQVAVLYTEAMMATNAVFALTIGNVTRYRPYLYGTEGGSGAGSRRTGVIATNSFFGGHTANTATVTFFTAKVLHDFNPGSPAEPYIWTAAALLPVGVAAARIQAGKHFLTDNLVGYAVGAASGLLVPQLHKKKNDDLSIAPLQGLNINGYPYGGLMLTKRL
jgi:membrane-associated phospholipid phosphatase